MQEFNRFRDYSPYFENCSRRWERRFSYAGTASGVAITTAHLFISPPNNWKGYALAGAVAASSILLAYMAGRAIGSIIDEKGDD